MRTEGGVSVDEFSKTTDDRAPNGSVRPINSFCVTVRGRLDNTTRFESNGVVIPATEAPGPNWTLQLKMSRSTTAAPAPEGLWSGSRACYNISEYINQHRTAENQLRVQIVD
jgi:hypothetical protein